MKLIIEVNTNNIEEMVEARDLLNSYTVKIVTKTDTEDVKEEITTPTIPEEVKEPEEAPVVEKPKRKRRSKAEIEAEKALATPPEEIVVPTPVATEMTLGELKELAQETVARTNDRIKVKDLIAKYGAKLNEVPEESYSELAEALRSL